MRKEFVLKSIRKLSAVGAGALMAAGMTASAMAMDLSDYPAPYVVDGTYDASNVFVVGENAAASDTLGVLDIGTDLQFKSKVCAESSIAGQVSISGDAVAIGDETDLLEINEYVGDVRETLTEVELEGLRGGTVTTDEGSTEWNQYLRFQDSSNNLSSPVVKFVENDETNEVVDDFLYLEEGSAVTSAFFEYELEFEQGFESDVSSGSLEDLINEELVMLGETYTVVKATIDTSADDLTLELLGGATTDVLEEGETGTYVIDGKEYTVEVVIITDSTPNEVSFRINDQLTDQLGEGETEVLDDGTLIGASEIISNEAGDLGGQDIVEFYLGANKVELKDQNYGDDETGTNAGYEQGVTIDEESVEEGWVQIKLTELSSGTEAEITSIKYRLVADALPGQSNVFVPEGHGVREYLDEPQGMLGQEWDIRYEGLMDTGVSVIKFEPHGDDTYNMIFTNRQGQTYDFPLVTNDGTFNYGDDDDDLWFREGVVNGTTTLEASHANDVFPISEDDYFIISNMDADGTVVDDYDESAFTHVLRYGSIDTTNQELSFDDLATGTKEIPYQNTSIGNRYVVGLGNLVVGGNTYNVYVSNTTGNNLAIDLNGDNDVGLGSTAANYSASTTSINTQSWVNRGATAGLDEARITVQGGGVIDLGDQDMLTAAHASSHTHTPIGTIISDPQASVAAAGAASGKASINVTLHTQASEFDEQPTGGEWINIYIENRTGSQVGIASKNSVQGVTLYEPDDDEDHQIGMTNYGVYFDLYDEPGSDEAETLTIEYPDTQRGANVFVTMGETTTQRTEAGQSCTVADITPVSKTDAEIAGASDNYNLILVGGPCANDLVADYFMACEDWPYAAGEGVLKMAANGDKVALLVAGTNAMDTRIAAKVLANADDFELSGMEAVVKGSSLDLSTVTVEEATMAAPEEPEESEETEE